MLREAKGERRKAKEKEKQIRIFWIFFLFSLFSLLSSTSCWALTSDELISQAKMYDGQEVQYEGEPIGVVLKRGDFVWLNFYDGSNAVAVWMPGEMSTAIRYIGRYGVQGDQVGLVGTFHRACSQHGGALDIHARTMSVLQEGGFRPQILERRKIMILIVLLGVLACLLSIHIFAQRQSSK